MCVNSSINRLSAVSPGNSVTVTPDMFIASSGDPSVTFTCGAEGGPGNAIFWLKSSNERPAVFNFTSSHGMIISHTYSNYYYLLLQLYQQ